MRRLLNVGLFVGLLSVLAPCQNGRCPAHQVTNGPSQMQVRQSEVVIPRDTLVQLRLMEGLSTVTDHKRYVVHLEVASDVVVGGMVVARAGTLTSAKITHDGSLLELSNPQLNIGGRTVRLSENTAAERGELGAEEGAAIGMVIFAAPLILMELPIVAARGVTHAVRGEGGKSKPDRYVFSEKGEILTYYVRTKTRVKLSAAGSVAIP